MKQTLLMFFLMTTMILQGQVTFSPETPEILGLIDDDDLVLDLEITNALEQSQDVFWTIELTDVKEEWEFQMCDKNLCYFWGVHACPENRPSELNPSESWPFMLHMDPNEVCGEGSITVHLSSPFDTVIESVAVAIDIDCTSVSTDDLGETDLNIYPNPTSDIFQIKNDDQVGKVNFFNIVGKKMSSHIHNTGKTYDVSHLNKGIYLVRLFDKNDNILKVVRLNKN